MTVVKHTNAERMIKEALVLDLGDLQREGDRIVAQAHDEARRIIADAQQEAKQRIDAADAKGFEVGNERGNKEGHEKGFGQGRTDAFNEFETRLSELTDAWNNALTSWERQRNDLLLEARTDVLRFALALARKIIHSELTIDPLIVQRQLEEALKLVNTTSSIAVSICPDDRPVVDAAVHDLLEDIGSCEHIQVKENSDVTRGGCIITTVGGSIDATIETQLMRIAQTPLPAPAAAEESEPGTGEADSQDLST